MKYEHQTAKKIVARLRALALTLFISFLGVIFSLFPGN